MKGKTEMQLGTNINSKLRLAGLLIVIPTIANALPTWDGNNKPDWFNNQFNKLPIESKLGALKLEGRQQDHLPFADSYWPLNLGGIAYRWYVPRTEEELASREGYASLPANLRNELKQDAWSYKLYSREEVRRLPIEALKVLSPAEKYDIFRGKFAYPTVKDVRKRSPKDSEYWEGICNGWAAAAMNHAEPAAVTVTSEDGIKIPFGSADVKALLAWMYQKSFTDDWWQRVFKRKHVERAFVGDLCRDELLKMSDQDADAIAACADVNAGAFHIVIANQIGREGRGLLMDYDRGHEIWNQPVFAYDSRILGQQAPSKGATVGTVSEVIVETNLYFADDTFNGVAYWEPSVGTQDYAYDYGRYKYRLELDRDGKIIGGQWMHRDLTDLAWLDQLDRSHPKIRAMKEYEVPPTLAQYRKLYDRPDDLWLNRPLEFTGAFEDLGKIYQPAVPGNVDFKQVKSAMEWEHEELLHEAPEAFR